MSGVMEVSHKATGYCPPNVRCVNHIVLLKGAQSLNSISIIYNNSISMLLLFVTMRLLNDTPHMHCIAPAISDVRNIECSSK